MTFLSWQDYIVFVTFLMVSLLIGVYHGFIGGGQKTARELLTGNRRLSVIPTMLSLMVSFQSAIMFLGSVAEMTAYGYSLWPGHVFSVTVCMLITERFILPVYYPLKLTSVFEYLDLRYKSKTVRLMASTFGILSAIMYMALAMFAPCVALEYLSGFPLNVTVPLMAIICVGYTAFGGMKAVIWTDVFQCIIMVSGTTVIVIKGIYDAGGIGHIYDTVAEHGRFTPFEYTIDPRERHTVWGFSIGLTMFWLANYGLSQASVQRYCATSTMKQARRLFISSSSLSSSSSSSSSSLLSSSSSLLSASSPLLSASLSTSTQTFIASSPSPQSPPSSSASPPASLSSVNISCSVILLVIPSVFVMTSLVFVVGLIIFTHFVDRECDPMASGYISSYNLLFPVYIRHVFVNFKGFTGVFMSMLYGGALSSISSSLSGTSANTWEDMLKPRLPKISESHATFIIKLIVVLYGSISVCLVYVLNLLPGTITKLAIQLMGAIMSPIFGVFILALCFRKSEHIGAITGIVCGFVTVFSICIGSMYYSDYSSALPFTSIDQCPNANATIISGTLKPQATGFSNIFTISYLWYLPLGTVVTVFVGLVVSIFIKWKNDDKEVLPDTLFINFRRAFDLSNTTDNDEGEFKINGNEFDVEICSEILKNSSPEGDHMIIKNQSTNDIRMIETIKSV